MPPELKKTPENWFWLFFWPNVHSQVIFINNRYLFYPNPLPLKFAYSPQAVYPLRARRSFLVEAKTKLNRSGIPFLLSETEEFV
jgi:hypothetical protein